MNIKNILKQIINKNNIPLLTSITIILILIIGLTVGFLVNNAPSPYFEYSIYDKIKYNSLLNNSYNLDEDFIYFTDLLKEFDKCRQKGEDIKCPNSYECSEAKLKAFNECIDNVYKNTCSRQKCVQNIDGTITCKDREFRNCFAEKKQCINA